MYAIHALLLVFTTLTFQLFTVMENKQTENSNRIIMDTWYHEINILLVASKVCVFHKKRTGKTVRSTNELTALHVYVMFPASVLLWVSI